jgi:hypothetical protein
MSAAMMVGMITQQRTIAIVCEGIIPRALKMPTSWSRWRVAISTELSTPSAASLAPDDGLNMGRSAA